MVANNLYDDDEVINYEEYNPDYLRFCVPFKVNHKDFDTIISEPVSTKFKLNVDKLGYTRKSLSSHTYLLNSNDCQDVLRTAKLHYNCIKANLICEPMLCRTFSEVIDIKKMYMMKLVNTPNYRCMYTSLKEILMQDRVYTSSYKDYKGSDIVTQPTFCTPFWNGSNWQFMIISQFAQGKSLHKFRGPLRKFFKLYDKQHVMKTMYETIKTFWFLGFSHNDLSDHNVIYDLENNKVRIIDFESCVMLPPKIVSIFRDSLQTSSDIVASYTSHYKYPSLSLLSLSESICCKFININTDDLFLGECERRL